MLLVSIIIIVCKHCKYCTQNCSGEYFAQLRAQFSVLPLTLLMPSAAAEKWMNFGLGCTRVCSSLIQTLLWCLSLGLEPWTEFPVLGAEDRKWGVGAEGSRGAALGKLSVHSCCSGALTQPQQRPLYFSRMPMKLLIRKSILSAASSLGFHGDCWPAVGARLPWLGMGCGWWKYSRLQLWGRACPDGRNSRINWVLLQVNLWIAAPLQVMR